MNPVRPSTLKVWWLACRPKTLLIGLAPVAIGLGLAKGDGAFHAPTAILTLVTGLLVQILSNLVNDLADFQKGTDDENRLGPPRVTAMGWVSPEGMRVAIAVTGSLVVIGTIFLAVQGGWPILILGAASMLFAWAYTAGPFPLGYHGLGDLFAFVFFGPVAVSATYYLQTDRLTSHAIWAGIAPGAFSTALLTVNNLRDIHGDRLNGKRTLAVRFGETFAKVEYQACLALSIAGPVAVAFLTGKWWCLCAPGALAVALPAIRLVRGPHAGAGLNAALGRTALTALFFSGAFALACLIP